MCYLNDINIYSKNIEENKHYIFLVLQKLRDIRLYMKIEKYLFYLIQEKYLKHIIFNGYL